MVLKFGKKLGNLKREKYLINLVVGIIKLLNY